MKAIYNVTQAITRHLPGTQAAKLPPMKQNRTSNQRGGFMKPPQREEGCQYHVPTLSLLECDGDDFERISYSFDRSCHTEVCSLLFRSAKRFLFRLASSCHFMVN